MSRQAFRLSVLLMVAMVSGACFLGCDVESRTATLKAQVDIDKANNQWIVKNLENRPWNDVTFTVSEFYKVHVPSVPANGVVRIPFSKLVDEHGEVYDPTLGYKPRMWINTPTEYWGLH